VHRACSWVVVLLVTVATAARADTLAAVLGASGVHPPPSLPDLDRPVGNTAKRRAFQISRDLAVPVRLTGRPCTRPRLPVRGTTLKRPHALWGAAPLAVGLLDRGPAASRATHPNDHRTDRLHRGERLLGARRHPLDDAAARAPAVPDDPDDEAPPGAPRTRT
jgi:hypothetical protein